MLQSLLTSLIETRACLAWPTVRDISILSNTRDTPLQFCNYTTAIKGNGPSEGCAQPSAFTKATCYLPAEANSLTV